MFKNEKYNFYELELGEIYKYYPYGDATDSGIFASTPGGKKIAIKAGESLTFVKRCGLTRLYFLHASGLIAFLAYDTDAFIKIS